MAITLVLAGGLGNQLFQYAAARALALRHNTSLVLDLRWYASVPPRSSRWAWLLDLPIKAKVRNYRWQWLANGRLPRAVRRIAEPSRHIQACIGFDPDLQSRPNGTVLFGMFHSPRHFSESYALFSGELDLSAVPAAAANPAIRRLDLPGAVGIHVRRGDYLNYPGFVLKDGDAYYRTAMDEVRARGERAVVFSDDIAWCREQEYFAGAEFYPESEGPPYVDLHAMSRCRRLVIANSTFSWWAGWFAHRRGAEVTAPRHWSGGHTSEEFEIIPAGWRVV